MTSSEEMVTLENDIIETVQNVETKPKGKHYDKIRTAPHRHLPNGKYDDRPISPTYFVDYYAAHKKPTECPHCHRIFTHTQGLYKHHIRSEKCKKIRGELTHKEMSALAALALVSAISEFEKLD